MKNRTLLLGIIFIVLITLAELAVLTAFAFQRADLAQDTVAVNEIVQSVKNDWENMEYHVNKTGLDYVVLDGEGNVRYRTKDGLSESVNAAISHRDTVVTVQPDNDAAGEVIIYNDAEATFGKQKKTVMLFLAAVALVQCGVCIGYTFYLNHTLVKPFHKLEGFAERVAGGNLDIPLEMDRHNIFGAFTESFDIMRSELKKARIAEAKANEDKKELIAKLSHDIKTPVASIKAASELGYAIAESEKIKENYTQIIQKADQINTLITNLFTATLEELDHLSVNPVDMESRQIGPLLESADYLHRAVIPDIPDCLILADRLRLLQVFDNIFANSYKYADTKIEVTAEKEKDSLLICMEDFGGGVTAEELPLLKEKFKRGGNADSIEGAGLGLFISDRFMKEMHGDLRLENGNRGLRVTVALALSGTI